MITVHVLGAETLYISLAKNNHGAIKVGTPSVTGNRKKITSPPFPRSLRFSFICLVLVKKISKHGYQDKSKYVSCLCHTLANNV